MAHIELVHICKMTHSYAAWLIRVTWRFHIRHDSPICGTTHRCDMTPSYMAWLVHMWLINATWIQTLGAHGDSIRLDYICYMTHSHAAWLIYLTEFFHIRHDSYVWIHILCMHRDNNRIGARRCTHEWFMSNTNESCHIWMNLQITHPRCA